LPVKKLVFHADPKSLQPADSMAWRALRIITGKMTVGGVEPVMVLVDAKDSDEFQAHWSKLQAHWMKEFEAGNLKNVSSPAPFVMSQSLQKENIAKLSGVDFEAARSALKKIMADEGFTEDSFKNSFTLLDSLEAISKGNTRLLDWSITVPKNSVWRFMLDKFFSAKPNVAVAYITPNATIATEKDRAALENTLNTDGVPIHITGWSYTLATLIPWSHSKLLELCIAIIAFNVILLIFLYRKLFPLLVLMLSLFMSIGAMVATLKLFAIPLNLFNVLAFPLVLGVGVDYGIYVLLAIRSNDEEHRALTTILKPVFLSGLCTICGFGSLVFAHNPSLSGLGVVCALGVGWCLLSTMLFILPIYVWKNAK
jgi:predicted RND superfamily exporter protein